MRLCQVLTCDEPAVVWFKGPWCSLHSNLLGDAPARAEAGSAAALNARPLGRWASSSGSLGVPEPAAPISDEFTDLLEAEGWDVLDLEWRLVEFLENS